MNMPDQCPVFQGDDPSNLIGWPTFQPSRLAGLSTVVSKNTCQSIAAKDGNPEAASSFRQAVDACVTYADKFGHPQ